ncbi:MAG: DUF2804 family protein [Ruminococcus sp.]|nr:DUF2804 family protein [Ruminococcus sp.]
MQQVLDNKKKIFNEHGEITFGGWSKSPLFDYNKEAHPAQNKITEGESFFISNEKMAFYLAYEITGIDLTIKIILADYKAKEIFEDSISKRMLLDPVSMPKDDGVGEFNYKDKKIALTVTNSIDGKYVKCDFIDFSNIKNLFVKLFLKDKKTDSMNMLTPFEKSKTTFYYKTFAQDYTASGVIRFGGIDYNITDENSLVYFTKTRYLLSRRRRFQSICGAAKIGGHTLTLNLASKVGSNRFGSENCYFVDDKLIKIGRTKVVGDDKSVTGNWDFSTIDETLNVTFSPIRTEKGYLACKCDKTAFVVGKLNGTIETEDFKINLNDRIFHMIFTVL